ncbi:MAG TPA: 1-deoxy-D-xylulose-5-phosphate reductoisomerase, partial [Actinomycetota bacterium]|nr:1-deoxy-D-xylulose-5-phosphate reductoisomerase [Actinomycetota bacterium]
MNDIVNARRRVAVLGSTGSIGRQALDVLKMHPDRFELVALGAGSDTQALEQQARAFPGVRTALGVQGAHEIATADDVDLVLNGIVGAAGLKASVAALQAGKILALANKESLVAGGRVCLDAAATGGGTIVPVDSEHAALAQCLEGRSPGSVERVVLTASGGPFRTRDDLSDVTPADALAHPTWEMGPKITVDCATLFNKGFEVIEAHFLFGFGYDAIDVVVHPQSVVHAMAQLVDGSFVM